MDFKTLTKYFNSGSTEPLNKIKLTDLLFNYPQCSAFNNQEKSSVCARMTECDRILMMASLIRENKLESHYNALRKLKKTIYERINDKLVPSDVNTDDEV